MGFPFRQYEHEEQQARWQKTGCESTPQSCASASRDFARMWRSFSGFDHDRGGLSAAFLPVTCFAARRTSRSSQIDRIGRTGWIAGGLEVCTEVRLRLRIESGTNKGKENSTYE